jgi:hypothetical protein
MGENVPHLDANQAAHARYALPARIFLLGGFVSVENKERLSYFSRPDVAGSIPVARSNFRLVVTIGLTRRRQNSRLDYFAAS